LFLSGGASIMPYTAQFFAEKLNVPVEYFNPFRNVQIDPAVDLEDLSRVAHGLGEVVGLGLRNLATCPVEMNLMPDSTLRWQSFNQKKPYFVATVISLVLVAFGVGFLFQKLAVNKEAEIARLTPQVSEQNAKMERFKKAYGNLRKSQTEAGKLTAWLQQRYYWGDFLGEMRHALLRSEADIQKKISAQKSGVDVGIWIEQMNSASNLGAASAASATAPMPGMGMPGGGRDPRNPYMRGEAPPVTTPPPGGDPTQPVDATTASTSTNSVITLVCRAVRLTGVDAPDSEIAYAVENEIKSSPFVDPKATSLVGNIVPDEATGTFSFTLNVMPLNPLNY
jgi:hypothetical protein